jgi:hypothetical protein
MELARRATPLIAYLAREAGDPRLDATVRAVLGALAADIHTIVTAGLGALSPEGADEAAVRELERARARLRTARQLGEVA